MNSKKRFIERFWSDVGRRFDRDNDDNDKHKPSSVGLPTAEPVPGHRPTVDKKIDNRHKVKDCRATWQKSTFSGLDGSAALWCQLVVLV